MRTWFLLLGLLAAGCGDHGSSPPATTAAPIVSAAPDDPTAPSPQEAGEEAAQVEELARWLAGELALDAPRAEQVRAAIARAWSDTRAEVRRRVEEGGDLGEEAMTDYFAARQGELDVELGALLSPEERAAFAELGGRLAGAE